MSSILARRCLRADALPEEVSFSRYDRSSAVSLMKYFWYIFPVLEVGFPSQVTRFMPVLAFNFDEPLTSNGLFNAIIQDELTL